MRGNLTETKTAHRKRMDSLLENAVCNPLVILSAGSGHGKTEAVSSFLAQSRMKVVWIHLTELDNFSWRFWALLTKAVEAWSPTLAGRMREEQFPDSVPALQRYLEQFAAEAYQEERIILVLDNFHCLQDGPVLEFVQFLIDSQVENLSVVLISGSEVNVRLSGLAGTVQLTDRQLRFTTEEIRIYYTALGIVLTEEQLARVHRLSEGWAFAVYLLGMHLRKNAPLDEGEIDNAVGHLFQIIDSDIFAKLEPDVQQAAVLLSLLGEFTIEMASELTGLSSEKLLALTGDITLISYRPENSSYYFHYLLRQFLTRKQLLLVPEERDAFLARAARWHEERESYVDALTLYARCAAHGDIVRCMTTIGAFHAPRDIARGVLQIIDSFPTEYVRAHPIVEVIRANMYFAVGQHDRVGETLEALQRDLSAREQTAEVRTALGECCNMLAIMSLRERTYDFVGLFKKASECLPEGSTLYRRGRLLFIGNGSALPYPGPAQGEMVKMHEAMLQAMPYSDISLGGLGYGREYLAAAEMHYYTGELKQAEEHAFRAIAKAGETAQWDIVCCAYYILMRVCMARGEYIEVENCFAKLRNYADRCSQFEFFGLPDIAEAGLLLKLGQRHKIARWIIDLDQEFEGYGYIYSGREFVMKAGYLIADFRYYETLAYIKGAVRKLSEGGQWFSAFKLLILKALCYYYLEEYPVAAKALEATWELAAGNNVVMPYAEYGNPIRNLIHRVREVGGYAMPEEWMDLIYAKASTYAKNHAILARSYHQMHPESVLTLDKLTQREHEVILLVCQGLTNEEIAEKQNIQVSSVKGTLGRIYGKIGAVNRADAVRIAVAELRSGN